MAINRKMQRYHREIFFPDWSEDALKNFTDKISNSSSIVFSIHALEKVVDASFQYGKQLFKYLLKSVRRSSMEPDSVFEFYAVRGEIKRACFRFSYDVFSVDLVLVISSDSTVVTVYTINKGDLHDTLNTKLYERS